MPKIPNPHMPKIYVGEKTWKMFKKVIEDITKKEQKKEEKDKK